MAVYGSTGSPRPDWGGPATANPIPAIQQSGASGMAAARRSHAKGGSRNCPLSLASGLTTPAPYSSAAMCSRTVWLDPRSSQELVLNLALPTFAMVQPVVPAGCTVSESEARAYPLIILRATGVRRGHHHKVFRACRQRAAVPRACESMQPCRVRVGAVQRNHFRPRIATVRGIRRVDLHDDVACVSALGIEPARYALQSVAARSGRPC